MKILTEDVRAIRTSSLFNVLCVQSKVQSSCRFVSSLTPLMPSFTLSCRLRMNRILPSPQGERYPTLRFSYTLTENLKGTIAKLRRRKNVEDGRTGTQQGRQEHNNDTTRHKIVRESALGLINSHVFVSSLVPGFPLVPAVPATLVRWYFRRRSEPSPQICHCH